MNTLQVKIFPSRFFGFIKPSDDEVNAFVAQEGIVLMGRGIDPQPNGSVIVFYRELSENEVLGTDGKVVEALPAMPSLETEKVNTLKTLIEHRNEYLGNRIANEFNLRKYKAHEDRLIAKIRDCDQRLSPAEGDQGLTGDEKHKVQMERQELEKALKEMVANRENVEKSIKDNDLHLVLIPELIRDVEEGKFVLAR